MKRIFILLSFILLSSLIPSFVSAEACNLDVTMLNQDPYPVIPGDYVKVVFQVTGVENPECGKISFKLIEKYPFSLDSNVSSKVKIEGGTYQNDFNSDLLIPYKLRVDKNAIEGENELEIRLSSNDLDVFSKTKKFSIEVKNVLADFEIFVKDYNFETKVLTLGILNIADSNVKALTLEIPRQNNIQIIGSNINIIGDLDSNDDSTADFKAVLKNGNVKVKVSYNDVINERRVLEKNVSFDPTYFLTQEKSKGIKDYTYLIYIFIFIVIVFLFFRKYWKKKERTRKKSSARFG